MPGRMAGAFVGQTGTPVDKSADAISAMFEVFDKMRQADVTDVELADAKRRVAGGMVMQMQTIGQQADRRLEGILNGYPADYYDKYAQRVSEVTADQIKSAMEKYVDPKVMQIVVVAPAEQSKEKLGALGEVKVEPMPGKAREVKTRQRLGMPVSERPLPLIGGSSQRWGRGRGQRPWGSRVSPSSLEAARASSSASTGFCGRWRGMDPSLKSSVVPPRTTWSPS